MESGDLSERLITAGEFATMLGVTEDDVLGWMLEGRIAYVDGPGGGPRVRIRERHSVDGPLSQGLVFYSMERVPEFRSDLARRRRELELELMDWGPVDLRALGDALASRFNAVIPPPSQMAVDDATLWLRDVAGDIGGIDVAFAASFPDGGSGAERVRNALAMALERVQDELAETTTDPWPRCGSGELPTPRAEFTHDNAMVRGLYGSLDDPVLELEPVRVSEVLREPSRWTTS